MVFGKIFKKKNNFPQSKHVIEYAFTCGGIDYYQYEDVFNLPYQRALQALVYYREVSLNCTRDFLMAHVEAVRNCLTPTEGKKVIDVNSVYVLNEQLSQRLQLPTDTELLYKLSSVVYFDMNENPTTYEFKYGAKKIEHWKKHMDVKSFFLQKPLRELIPFLSEYGESIDQYQVMLEKVNHVQSEKISQHLSDERKNLFLSKLKSQAEATPQS